MSRTSDEPHAALKRLQRVQKWALQSEDARKLNAMIALATSEPTIPVLPEHLDRDPFLLNVQNGTIDLRTGKLREHRREDLLTKIAPVTYDEGATCPLWRRFLDQVFAGDEELIEYVQRLIGYGLTGDVREQILPIFWGKGANGKSTFIIVVMAMLGEEYAAKASRDLFMARKADSHPTQLARLFGRRIVVCTETQEGGRLDEGLVKELTGGDAITARRMREDYWQYTPTHKPILITNHKPEIKGTDKGIRRRLRLVPFNVRFWNPDDPEERAKGLPEELKQDKELTAKLLGELPGILNWAIEGCLSWQSDGLGLPGAVKAETSRYIAEQDRLSAFITDACATGKPDYRVRARDLYAKYTGWCKRTGEEPCSLRKFGEMIDGLEGIKKKVSNGTWYTGIMLLSDENDEYRSDLD
jgi:putative DNA primase/helicase